MGVKVRGNARRQLKSMVEDITTLRVRRAMAQALIIGSTRAASYTPIDTSTLINSQYREITQNGTRITGRVGYSANYAAYVADPNIPQRFRLSTAKKEFLTKGFDDEWPQIEDVFRRELSK